MLVHANNPSTGKRRQKNPGCPLASQAGQLGVAVLFRDSVTENKVASKGGGRPALLTLASACGCKGISEHTQIKN